VFFALRHRTYYGCENYYGKDIFLRKDFVKLRDILKGIKGKFILSINKTTETKVLFKGFRIEDVQTTYSTAGAHKKKSVKELLVMNFG